MRVLYVQYTNPGMYPPLVRGAQLLAESGADVRMLGVSVRGLDSLDVPAASRVHVALMPAATDGWRLKAHYARYAAWVAREGTAWRPDWIYASDLLATPVALALAAVTGARVVYHEHDAPSQEHESWAIRRCLDARQRLLRQADVVITPNAERSDRLSAVAGGRGILTVWNCPRRPLRAPARVTHDGALRVLFRGSINSDRLPMTVVDAVARVDGAQLDIVGYETVGSRGHVGRLLSHASALGMEERIRALGPMSDADLVAMSEQSDVGLALMPVDSPDENMRHMSGASNKVFEYIAHGVTPLVSDAADWRSTFIDTGYALACDPRDSESILAALRRACDHRDATRAMATRAWERLQTDWNYEAQFAPVLNAMWQAQDRARFDTVTSRHTHSGVTCAS